MRIVFCILITLAIAQLGVAQEDSCYFNNAKAEKEFRKAKDLARKKDYSGSAELIRKLLDDYPTYNEARKYLALIYDDKKNSTGALKQYEQIIAICEDYDYAIQYKLGTKSFAFEDYEKAIEYLMFYMDNEVEDIAKIDEADSLVRRATFLRDIYANPLPFDPIPVKGVSTNDDEYLPILSPDNEFFFYTRKYGKPDKSNIFGGETEVEEFFMSTMEGKSYTKGDALIKPFNYFKNQGGATLTLDNNEMFLTICNDPEGFGSCDLYYTYKTEKGWADLENMGEKVNSKKWDSQVSIAPNGSIMYFASDREGGYGGQDIYKIVRINGKWSEPINLGPQINTSKNEKSPFIHIDNRTLYFSSQGHDNLGGYDIFICRKDSGGTWTKARNIGHPINSPQDDLSFFVSSNGNKGYFASNKLKGVGGWDIYEFALHPSLRPEKIMLVKGFVKDENGEILKKAKLELLNLGTDEVESIKVDSLTGKYVFSKEMHARHTITVSNDGHFFDSKSLDNLDTTVAVHTEDFELETIREGKSYTINNIFFETNSFDLKPKSITELENLKQLMEFNPSMRISIDGHTDNVGDANKNQVLSENRAKAVYQKMIDYGVVADRLQYKGYGEDKPVADNTSTEGKAKNRRTEITILSK